MPPNLMVTRLGSTSRSSLPAHLPTAATSRPTFGSLPATAHLNRGELTMARPSSRRCFGSSRSALRVLELLDVRGRRSYRLGGEADAHVGGGLVAVHGDAVEGLVHHLPQHAAKLVARYLQIREDEGEHRRHVGLNHPSSLGNAHHPGAVAELPTAELRVAVGGHDGLGHREQLLALQGRRGIRELRLHRRHRQPPADHAGAAGQHQVPRRQAQGFCGRLADALGVGLAVPRGAHVADLGVHHHRLDRLLRQAAPQHLHRRSWELARRGHGGEGRRRPLQLQQRHRHHRAHLGRLLGAEAQRRRAHLEAPGEAASAEPRALEVAASAVARSAGSGLLSATPEPQARRTTRPDRRPILQPSAALSPASTAAVTEGTFSETRPQVRSFGEAEQKGLWRQNLAPLRTLRCAAVASWPSCQCCGWAAG
eukprot:scaffold3051_cov236-Pinguiococcus_pyrenoidosus.AAC.6